MDTILIFSTMTGQSWEGESESRDLEAIFREFNRVDDADCQRLEDKGYDLPSLSTGDFVGLSSGSGEYEWYLCAGTGWQPVTTRQVLIPQMDYQYAKDLARQNGKPADEVRPPMFLNVDDQGALVYMHPASWWKRVPADGPSERHEERPS